MIPDIIKFFNGGKNSLFPTYGSLERAKFAYDAGSRNPEAIGAALPNRRNLDGTIEGGNVNSTSSMTTTNYNGLSNPNFESKSTISYEDGLYDTIEMGNTDNNGITNSYEHYSFGMPNGDRYHIYNNGGTSSSRYETNFIKRLGMDKLPKPKQSNW